MGANQASGTIKYFDDVIRAATLATIFWGIVGEGFQPLGAPKLNDAIWLYGGELEDISAQIRAPKHGMMPGWEERLSPEVIKQLAVYVHSLGGGTE